MDADRDPDVVDEIDLRPYIEFARRHWKIILGVTAGCIVLAFALSFATPRGWLATATVMVPTSPATGQTQVLGGIQTVPPTVVYSEETYARLVKSSAVLDRVVKRLKLGAGAADLVRRVTARPVQNTRLLEITVVGSDRDQTGEIANAIAAALIEYDSEVASAEIGQAREFVLGQLTQARLDLQAKEQALTQFAQREDLAAMEAELNRRLTDLTNLRQAAQQNSIDLEVALRKRAQLETEQATAGPQLWSQLTAQKAALDIDVAAFREKQRVLAEVISSDERASADLNTSLAAKHAELNRLTRAADTEKGMFTTLSGKAVDALVAESAARGAIRIVDQAVVRPAPRETAAHVALAVLFGVALGTLAAVMVERVKTLRLAPRQSATATAVRRAMSQLLPRR